MLQSRKATAVRLLTELCVIVLGVLIALAVDSWSQGIQEAERARGYLDALRLDMADAVATLDASIDLTRRQDARVAAFLQLLSSDQPVPDTVNRPRVQMGGFVLSTGTLDALVETGDVNRLGSEALRAEVLGTRAALSQLEDDFFQERTTFRNSEFDGAAAWEDLRVKRGLDSGVYDVDAARRNPRIIAFYQGYRRSQGYRMFYLRRMREWAVGLLELVEIESESSP